MSITFDRDQLANQGVVAATNSYGNIYISDNARVLLGNASSVHFHSNADSTAEEDLDRTALLRTLYYESMNSRRNQIFTADESTCQWIWNTTFEQWLADAENRLFWVAGKPGSGKSTLMKHLSKSPKVKSSLPQDGSTWLVLSFFFDFRVGDKVANLKEGLLRALLHQIISLIPSTLKGLNIERNDIGDLPVDQLEKMFLTIVSAASSRFLILVDGLDEHTGNMRLMLKFLTGFREYQSVKLCIASRPEPLIREMLHHITSLQVSEHNSAGIQQYISDAIKDFQPLLDALKLHDIRDLLIQRAEGVFLWVYFAVENVLQTCVEGALAEEVKQQLTSLPSDLEVFYQRILDKVPSQRRCEAAILFLLVSVAEFPVSIGLLQSTIYLLVQDHHFTAALVDIDSPELFARRIQGTIGGLLELSQCKEDGQQSLRNVQLVHETVRAFMIQSHWLQEWIPSEFKKKFPNHIWLRIYCKALQTGNNKTRNCIEDILSLFDGNMVPFTLPEFGSQSDDPSVLRIFANSLRGASTDYGLQRMIPVLFRAVKYVPYRCSGLFLDILEDLQLVTELKEVLQQKLLYMHFQLTGSIRHWSTFHEVRRGGAYDLYLASSCRIYGYLRDNMHRMKDLTDAQRDEIVALLIISSPGSRGQAKDERTTRFYQTTCTS